LLELLWPKFPFYSTSWGPRPSFPANSAVKSHSFGITPPPSWTTPSLASWGTLPANSIPVQAAFPSMTRATLPTSAFGGQQVPGTASGFPFLSFSLGPKLVFLLVVQLHLLTWAIHQLLAGALRPAVPTPVFILLLRSHSPSPLIRLPSRQLLVDLGQL